MHKYNGLGKIRIMGKVLNPGDTIEVKKENLHLLNKSFTEIKQVIKSSPKKEEKGE